VNSAKRGAFAITILSLAILAAGCARPSAPAAPARGKVALIGWDAATWEILDPLLAAGRLPNLARLLANGSRGVLVASPPLLSPVAWTTLATGFPPEAHGVKGFLLPDPRDGHKVLAASFHRHRAALWQIASANDRTVGFVGWWTTWPAEPVNGYVVSDHLAYNRWDAWAPRASVDGFHMTFPRELEAELAPLAIRPESLAPDTLTRIVPFDAREREEMMQAAGPVIFHGPSVFRFGFATDASNAAFARHLLATRPQPDLFAVVFVLSDVAGHVFLHHLRPESYPGLEADLHLAQAIPNVYAQLDAWTGEIVAKLDPATRIVLLSDHGMRPTGHAPIPRKAGSGDHFPDGILVVSGGGAPVGRDFGRVPSVALAPTVLALLGAPVGRDMPGQVVAEALPEGTLVLSGESYGNGTGADLPEGDSPAEEAVRQRLRSLGYIQ